MKAEMKNSISAVILSKNEAKNIAKCIANLKFCTEVIIIDDYSSDDTVVEAKKAGARVALRKLNQDFASQRNFGLKISQGNWVLFVDADEVVSEELSREIIKAVSDPKAKHDGYTIKRQDNIWGKRLTYGEFWTNSFLRLAKKEAGKWKRAVHEYWDVRGNIGRIKSPLLHYSHQTLNEFITKINWYSSLHSEANLKEGKRSSLTKIILYPKLKFIKNWIIKGGFLDGTEGFVVALVMSFHSFLAWSKLWVKQKQS
jgi:glycosyltransferase involved in cell wall biosynthesis